MPWKNPGSWYPGSAHAELLMTVPPHSPPGLHRKKGLKGRSPCSQMALCSSSRTHPQQLSCILSYGVSWGWPCFEPARGSQVCGNYLNCFPALLLVGEQLCQFIQDHCFSSPWTVSPLFQRIKQSADHFEKGISIRWLLDWVTPSFSFQYLVIGFPCWRQEGEKEHAWQRQLHKWNVY